MRTLLEALPERESPMRRVAASPERCNLIELLAVLVGGNRQFEVAQELIGRFEDLSRLGSAAMEELAQVQGVGPMTAARLRAAVELGRRLAVERQPLDPVISTPEDAAALLIPKLQHLEQEHLFVMLLDTRNKVLGDPIEIYHGSLNATMIRIGELLRPAVRANAAAIIVAHNHPSGDPTPSPEDVSVTRAIAEAGKLLDINILDHLVIGRGRYTSLKSKGLGF